MTSPIQQWKEEAKLHVLPYYDYRERILALIDVIEKKDQLIKPAAYTLGEFIEEDCQLLSTNLYEALALTDTIGAESLDSGSIGSDK